MKIIAKGDNILWVRDDIGIIIINPISHSYWLLTNIEADVWDWISLGIKHNDIVRFAAHYFKSSVEEASDYVNRIVEKWQKEGIINILEYDELNNN